MYIRGVRVRVPYSDIHTAWATVLLFRLKAIPEPDVRNSKIAVPLFCYVPCYREPILSKRGKTCEAVRAGKQLNRLTKMKKKFFLGGALVAMSMSAMFVACSDQNEPTNGCKCVVKAYGVESNITVTLDEMKQVYDVSTCNALASKYQSTASATGMNMSVSCTAY